MSSATRPMVESAAGAQWAGALSRFRRGPECGAVPIGCRTQVDAHLRAAERRACRHELQERVLGDLDRPDLDTLKRHDNETAEMHVKGRNEVLPVSRNYLHLFRQM